MIRAEGSKEAAKFEEMTRKIFSHAEVDRNLETIRIDRDGRSDHREHSEYRYEQKKTVQIGDDDDDRR